MQEAQMIHPSDREPEELYTEPLELESDEREMTELLGGQTSIFGGMELVGDDDEDEDEDLDDEDFSDEDDEDDWEDEGEEPYDEFSDDEDDWEEEPIDGDKDETWL